MKTNLALAQVAIIERVVLGVAGYRAECFDCPWKGTPREKEEAAVADARRHGAAHVSKRGRYCNPGQED